MKVEVQVLRVLQAAPGLVALLKGVEAALAPPGLRIADARRDTAAFVDLLPFLTDQALEWAATACASLDTSAPLPVCPILAYCLSLIPVHTLCCHIFGCKHQFTRVYRQFICPWLVHQPVTWGPAHVTADPHYVQRAISPECSISCIVCLLCTPGMSNHQISMA